MEKTIRPKTVELGEILAWLVQFHKQVRSCLLSLAKRASCQTGLTALEVKTKYLSAILHPLTQFYILFSVENYRKVCVHGSGKDSGGKGRLLDHPEEACSKLDWF